MNVANLTNASDYSDVKENNASNYRLPPDLIEERIRAYLETPNRQISNLTLLLSQLINGNSAKTTPTANSRAHCSHKDPHSTGKQEPENLARQQLHNGCPLLEAQQFAPQGYEGHESRVYEILIGTCESLFYLCCHP